MSEADKILESRLRKTLEKGEETLDEAVTRLEIALEEGAETLDEVKEVLALGGGNWDDLDFEHKVAYIVRNSRGYRIYRFERGEEPSPGQRELDEADQRLDRILREFDESEGYLYRLGRRPSILDAPIGIFSGMDDPMEQFRDIEDTDWSEGGFSFKTYDPDWGDMGGG